MRPRRRMQFGATVFKANSAWRSNRSNELAPKFYAALRRIHRRLAGGWDVLRHDVVSQVVAFGIGAARDPFPLREAAAAGNAGSSALQVRAASASKPAKDLVLDLHARRGGGARRPGWRWPAKRPGSPGSADPSGDGRAGPGGG